MYVNYVDYNLFKGIDKQTNLMILVGNGFDISVLTKFSKEKLLSTYSKFYDFLIYHSNTFNKDNLLFKNMQYEKSLFENDSNFKNWADFEGCLDTLIEDNNISQLERDLNELQGMFLKFLNEVVTNDILIKVDEASQLNHWTLNSYCKFLGDIPEDQYINMQFPMPIRHHTVFNIKVLNFNYTSLLDNYLFLDKSQFEPQPHRTIDTNFKFYPNPSNYINDSVPWNEDTVFSTAIMTEICHPHGYQTIPRSMLFGTENEHTNKYNKFNKSYWSLAKYKYQPYFKDTDLFIISGMSLGKTDSWWWKQLYGALKADVVANGEEKNKELIIYYYTSDASVDIVKDLFIQYAYCDEDKEIIDSIKSRIYVVTYNNSDNLYFLGFREGE